MLRLLAILLLGAALIHSAFGAGERMDEFALPDASGRQIALKYLADRVVLGVAGEDLKPKALLIHFFQPDCLQCLAQLKAEETLYQELGKQGFTALAVAHRGSLEALKEVVEHLKLSFPILAGAGTELAKKFASGDATYIFDEKGVVQFNQAGFGSGDEKLWKENIELLIQGKSLIKRTVDRQGLKKGDRMPAIVLNSLFNDKPMKLVGENEKLTFTGDDGKTVQPALTVGFFCRY